MTGTPWLAILTALVFAIGLLLTLAGRRLRRRCGLGSGETVSLDRVTLTSRRLGLTGRPDRLIRTGGHRGSGMVIPEEWKSSRSVRPWHHAQMGVYFLLIEERYGVRPPYGFLVCGGTRHRVDNTAELRAWVLELAGQIRRRRACVNDPIPVAPKPGQCRPCGMRGHCGQVRLQVG